MAVDDCLGSLYECEGWPAMRVAFTAPGEHKPSNQQVLVRLLCAHNKTIMDPLEVPETPTGYSPSDWPSKYDAPLIALEKATMHLLPVSMRWHIDQDLDRYHDDTEYCPQSPQYTHADPDYCPQSPQYTGDDNVASPGTDGENEIH